MFVFRLIDLSKVYVLYVCANWLRIKHQHQFHIWFVTLQARMKKHRQQRQQQEQQRRQCHDALFHCSYISNVIASLIMIKIKSRRNGSSVYWIWWKSQLVDIEFDYKLLLLLLVANVCIQCCFCSTWAIFHAHDSNSTHSEAAIAWHQSWFLFFLTNSSSLIHLISWIRQIDSDCQSNNFEKIRFEFFLKVIEIRSVPCYFLILFAIYLNFSIRNKFLQKLNFHLTNLNLLFIGLFADESENPARNMAILEQGKCSGTLILHTDRDNIQLNNKLKHFEL